MTNELKKYQEHGYTVVDNFLPEELANELSAMYTAEHGWEKINQARENFYQHICATKSGYSPGEDEVYMARFDRNQNLENHPTLNKIYAGFFIPSLKRFSETELKNFDIRCYRLSQGDFYRSHRDDYAGTIGCVYYLNKKWVWDWGGLLHINAYEGDDDFVETIFPKFNRAIFIDHEKFKFPHFVSLVSHYAKEPRYSIVSFNR